MVFKYLTVTFYDTNGLWHSGITVYLVNNKTVLILKSKTSWGTFTIQAISTEVHGSPGRNWHQYRFIFDRLYTQSIKSIQYIRLMMTIKLINPELNDLLQTASLWDIVACGITLSHRRIISDILPVRFRQVILRGLNEFISSKSLTDSRSNINR